MLLEVGICPALFGHLGLQQKKTPPTSSVAEIAFHGHVGECYLYDLKPGFFSHCLWDARLVFSKMQVRAYAGFLVAGIHHSCGIALHWSLKEKNNNNRWSTSRNKVARNIGDLPFKKKCGGASAILLERPARPPFRKQEWREVTESRLLESSSTNWIGGAAAKLLRRSIVGSLER